MQLQERLGGLVFIWKEWLQEGDGRRGGGAALCLYSHDLQNAHLNKETHKKAHQRKKRRKCVKTAFAPQNAGNRTGIVSGIRKNCYKIIKRLDIANRV